MLRMLVDTVQAKVKHKINIKPAPVQNLDTLQDEVPVICAPVC